MKEVHDKIVIIGSGPAGLHGGDLRRARGAAAAGHRRAGARRTARRAARQHHRGRELPRVPQGHPGARPDGAVPQAGGALRHQVPRRRRREGRPVEAAVHASRSPASRSICVTADALIIATGAQAKWLGLPSEKRLAGYGVSACATCDGFFFREQHVLVVGGGDTAMEEATYLTKHAKRVTVVHRREELPRLGDHGASARRRTRRSTGCSTPPSRRSSASRARPASPARASRTSRPAPSRPSRATACSWPSATSRTPTCSRASSTWTRTATSSCRAPRRAQTATKIPGVFAAGDVADHVYRQAVSAAGTGCMAAIDAERFLSH